MLSPCCHNSGLVVNLFSFFRTDARRQQLTEVLAIPLYPSVAFRLWQVPVCAVALVYMFDVLLAMFVV